MSAARDGSVMSLEEFRQRCGENAPEDDAELRAQRDALERLAVLVVDMTTDESRRKRS